jgi:methionine synthase II (cobalamin-independent)
VVQIDEPYMQARPRRHWPRICRALPPVPAERIIVAPDCGLKYLPRDIAFEKMRDRRRREDRAQRISPT